MDPLLIAAGVVLIFLIFLGIYVFVDLAGLPGRAAKAHDHPNAEAVKVAGIVGMLAGGILWPVALAWAFLGAKAGTGGQPERDKRNHELEERLARFEAELSQNDTDNAEATP